MRANNALRFFQLLFGSFLLLLATAPHLALSAQPSAPASFRVVSCDVVKTSVPGLTLAQHVLGTDGSTMHPGTAIPRGFAFEAMAQSGTRTLYLLRQTGRDSVLLLLTDSVGRTLQQLRQHRPRMGGDTKILAPPCLFGLPGAQGFVLTYPTGKSSRPTLQVLAMAPDLTLRWQQQLPSACLTTVQHITASDTHLWLVLKDYLALAPRPRIMNFRLTTGDGECNQPLAPNDELDVATVVPAGLLLLGTSDRRTSYTTPVDQLNPSAHRRDFALLLGPTGQRNFGVGLGWALPGRPSHYHWQAAYPLPNGGYQLIGETYRNIPDVGTIALGVLGGSMAMAGRASLIPLSGYSNEQPSGLVTAQLSTTGQLAAIHVLAVPEVLQAPGSPAASSDSPNAAGSSFRFRGFSADYQQVILNTSRQVLAYSIATQQLRPLTVLRDAAPTILAIEPARIVINWSAKPGDTGHEFEQLARP